MKQKLKKWWKDFTELKLWTQGIIVIVAIILIHNIILH